MTIPLHGQEFTCYSPPPAPEEGAPTLTDQLAPMWSRKGRRRDKTLKLSPIKCLKIESDPILKISNLRVVPSSPRKENGEALCSRLERGNPREVADYEQEFNNL